MRGLAAERPNERERGSDHVDGELESHRTRERQTVLGFTYNLIEWIACGQQNATNIAAGVGSKRRIALFVRHLKATPGRIDTLAKRSCPGHHERENRIGLASHALQAAAFGQIARHLSESIACVVMAKAVAGDKPDRNIVRWRGVAVAAREAEIHRPADGQRVQILVGV